MGTRTTRGRSIAGVIAVIILAGMYGVLEGSGILGSLDGAALKERIIQLGWLGPLAVISLMTLAVVMSPIPSAPIALAAGAVYGHTWGTLYVLIGAEAGSIIAFITARLLGYEVMKRWLGGRISLGRLGSQNMLMGMVFVSRLLPFISFDLVSYAAGLTPLTTWRFALATLAGIIPASFLLAHFGGEMGSADPEKMVLAVVVLGGLTFLSIVAKWFLDRSSAKRLVRSESR